MCVMMWRCVNRRLRNTAAASWSGRRPHLNTSSSHDRWSAPCLSSSHAPYAELTATRQGRQQRRRRRKKRECAAAAEPQRKETEEEEEYSSMHTASPSAAPRDAVLRAAASTAAALSALAVGVVAFASANDDDPSSRWLAALPSSAHDVAAGLGVAACVFAARKLVSRVVPDFKLTSDEANSVVLPNLSTSDLALVAALSGVSEELLFRWALLGLAPDWRGCVIAAAVFGALHVSGGRKPVFAVWATGVGLGYGVLALAASPASACVAHAASNFAAGIAWQRDVATGASNVPLEKD